MLYQMSYYPNNFSPAKILFFFHPAKKKIYFFFVSLHPVSSTPRIMKKGLYLYIIGVLAVALSACSDVTKHQDNPSAQPTDTIYSQQTVMEIYGKDPKRALAIVDSGVLLGTIEPDLATLLRATVYCKSPDEWPLDTAYTMLVKLMGTDFVNKNPANRWNVLDLLVGIARRRGDNVAYLQWATEKTDFCRLQGEETEALRTEAEIGAVLTRMGEVEKGLSKLDGVIGALDKQRHFNELDACIIAIKRKINVLTELSRHKEVIPLAKRIATKVSDYSNHPDIYDDGTYRLPPNDEERSRYCDFYTAQAYGFLAVAYANIGTLDSARHFLALLEESDYAKTLNGKMMASNAYLPLAQYNKLTPIYDEMEARMGNDTLNNDYAAILLGRATMAEAAGNYRDANNLRHRYGNLKDFINKQILESRAHEYAARYHLQEEQLKTERERMKAENNKRASIIYLLLAMAILLLCVWLLLSRIAAGRKNKVLVEQIAEAVKYKNIVEGQKAELARMNATAEGLQDAESQKIMAPNIKEMDDADLYDFLRMAIRNDKLFTDPNFGRQTLTDLYNVTDHRIGAAFSLGSGLTDFVRETRIQYACWLFNNYPEMTISEVSKACGFSSLPVFSREFKRKLDVTPTYYRSQL